MYGKSERFEDYDAKKARCVTAMAFRLKRGSEKFCPPRPHHHLLLVRAGAIQVQVSDQNWACGPDCALLWAPSTPATVIALSDCTVHVAQLNTASTAWRNVMASRVVSSGLIRALLSELVQVPNEAPSPRATRLGKVLRDEIGLEVFPPLHLPRPTDTRLRSVCDKILADPSLDWRGTNIASHAGMSERTLARRFVEAAGVPAAKWVRNAKLAAALGEVARGGSLYAAAAAAGFSGASSLCAAFKQATGSTIRGYFRRNGPPNNAGIAEDFV